MPGTAQTNEFFLSTATVMIGPMADLKTINPADHSLGLVKNFTLQSDPTVIELTQGIRNQRVASMVTNAGLKVSWEMYEYTAKNLAYAAGLDATGTNYAPFATSDVTNASASAAAVSVDVTGDHASSYPVGSWIVLQDGTDDKCHVAKVSAVLFDTPDTTITFTGYGLPKTLPAGATIRRLNKLDVGQDSQVHTFGMKVVGLIPKQNKPLILVFPKIQITKGLSIHFATDNFGNMPFEATPFAPVPADDGYDADFAQEVSILRS